MTTGLVGCVELGVTVVVKRFSGAPFKGIVVRYQHPYFSVVFEDGDTEDYTGKQLAAILRLALSELADPRRWSYDWNIINMSLVPDFLSCLKCYLSSYGFALPEIWAGPGLDASSSSNSADVHDDIGSYLHAEEIELKAYHFGLLSKARAARTLRNYRLPALKLLWFAYTRRWRWPPTPDEFGLYLSKLYMDRDNVGAPTTTKSAMSLLCSMNKIDGAPYNTLRATAAIDAARREHKHVAKKSAGLTVNMVAAINRLFSFERVGRAPNAQWEFAIGTAISLAFKILLRYDDLARCLWDPDFCDIFYTHVRYYVEGRKNDAHGCAFLDVARPADDNPGGVYFLLVRAKLHFRTGFVLPHIDRRTGVVDHTRPMCHGDFVAFLRSALTTIGMPVEEATLFAGQSARAGGATEAAAKGLHQEDIQHLAGVTSAEWLSWYNRRYLDERLRVSRALGL